MESQQKDATYGGDNSLLEDSPCQDERFCMQDGVSAV
jgi:hypothetical protein